MRCSEILSDCIMSRLHSGANHALAATHPIRVHEHDRGHAVSNLPGNFGDETSGHRMGGGKHRWTQVKRDPRKSGS